jgi:hypothetical protein
MALNPKQLQATTINLQANNMIRSFDLENHNENVETIEDNSFD